MKPFLISACLLLATLTTSLGGSPDLTTLTARSMERITRITQPVGVTAAYNRTTGVTYSTLKLALAGLNGVTATQNILIEWEGNQTCSGAAINTLNMGSFTLTIQPVGYVAGSYTNPRYVLDVGGADNCITLNNAGNNGLGNVRIQGGQINNYNLNSGAAKAISGLGTKGSCVVKDIVFTNGSIPIRWVGAGSGTTQSPYIHCEDLTIEDCVATHGYGAFRLGLGLASTERDFGNVIIRRCQTRWDRRYAGASPPTDGNAPSGHIVMALKNFTTLLIEDCELDGAGKSLIAIENTGTVTIRRNKFRNSGILNQSGGAIDVQAKSGYLSTLKIQSNLFTGCKTTIIYVDGSNAAAGTGEFEFVGNTIDEEASTSKNIIYLANGVKPRKNINNIYNLNTVGTATVWSHGVNVAGTAADWISDANVWYRPVTSRSLVGGSIGGTSVAATSLASLQAQTQNDTYAPTRDLHSTSSQPTFNKN